MRMLRRERAFVPVWFPKLNKYGSCYLCLHVMHCDSMRPYQRQYNTPSLPLSKPTVHFSFCVAIFFVTATFDHGFSALASFTVHGSMWQRCCSVLALIRVYIVVHEYRNMVHCTWHMHHATYTITCCSDYRNGRAWSALLRDSRVGLFNGCQSWVGTKGGRTH